MEVLGRYSNHSDQGERVQTLLEIVPGGPAEVKLRTHKQVQHRLRCPEVDDLLGGDTEREPRSVIWQLPSTSIATPSRRYSTDTEFLAAREASHLIC